MKPLIFIILSFFFLNSFSQDSLDISMNRRNTLQLNITNLLLKDISLNYFKSLDPKYGIEFIAGYRINSQSVGTDPLLIFSSKNPWWYYNIVSARVGFRYYLNNDFYISPMIMFNYGFYDKVLIKSVENAEGDLYDVDYIMSRHKYILGSFLKMGINSDSFKKVAVDYYFGLGAGVQSKIESIDQKIGFYGPITNENYPITSRKIKIIPTIHLGVQIGIKLK
jgi:hypothetical protein